MESLNRDVVDIIKRYILDDVYKRVKREYMQRFVFGSAWDRFAVLERFNHLISTKVLRKQSHDSIPDDMRKKIVSAWKGRFVLVNSSVSGINWRCLGTGQLTNYHNLIYTFTSGNAPVNDYDYETNSVAYLPESYRYHEIKGLTGKVINK